MKRILLVLLFVVSLVAFYLYINFSSINELSIRLNTDEYIHMHSISSYIIKECNFIPFFHRKKSLIRLLNNNDFKIFLRNNKVEPFSTNSEKQYSDIIKNNREYCILLSEIIQNKHSIKQLSIALNNIAIEKSSYNKEVEIVLIVKIKTRFNIKSFIKLKYTDDREEIFSLND